jgi:hypothetical protein
VQAPPGYVEVPLDQVQKTLVFMCSLTLLLGGHTCPSLHRRLEALEKTQLYVLEYRGIAGEGEQETH